jgi:hypothetical protein
MKTDRREKLRALAVMKVSARLQTDFGSDLDRNERTRISLDGSFAPIEEACQWLHKLRNQGEQGQSTS